MSPVDRLVRLVFWLLIAGIVAFVAGTIRDAALGKLPFSRVDPQTGTVFFFVETDAGTGCQYVITPWGGIVPRTGPDGRQLCAKK